MIDYSSLPEHSQESMQAWIETARPVGSFLDAILSNYLKESYARADHINQPRIIDYVKFLYNEAPIGSHGSPENVKNWRGLNNDNK